MSDSNNGRKIEAQYENPVDNAFIALSDAVAPMFKRLNFTPNGLTTLSAVFWGGAVYNLYNRETTEFTVYALLGYFFDVMDGYYARKYKMTSEAGDKYDHYKDVAVSLAIVYVLYSQYDLLDFPTLVIVLMALYFLMLVYLGCQEVMTAEADRSPTLSTTQDIVGKLDPTVCAQKMKYLRWFGTGTMVIVIICAALYLNGDFDSVGNALGIVPGADELRDMYEARGANPEDCVDGTMNVGDGVKPIVSSDDMMDDINLEFINELRNFGTTTLDSYEPYTTSNMVSKMIRD